MNPYLFAALNRPCAKCAHLDAQPTTPGVHYCYGLMMWRQPDERVDCREFAPAVGGR